MQDRATVEALVEWNDRLVAISMAGESVFDMAPEARAKLERLYRAAFEIYAGTYPSRVRANFEDLIGVPFAKFENAIEAVGWIVATPEARRRHCLAPALLMIPGAGHE